MPKVRNAATFTHPDAAKALEGAAKFDSYLKSVKEHEKLFDESPNAAPLRDIAGKIQIPDFVQATESISTGGQTSWGNFWSTEVLHRQGMPYKKEDLEEYIGKKGLFLDESIPKVPGVTMVYRDDRK